VTQVALRLWSCLACKHLWADQGPADRQDLVEHNADIPDVDPYSPHCPRCGNNHYGILQETIAIDRQRDIDELLALAETARPFLQGGLP
jgi:ribosomal protein L37AE/L43A